MVWRTSVMLRFLLLLSICATGTTTVSADDFTDITAATSSSLSKALSKKKYDSALMLIDDWFIQYNKLDRAAQDKHHHIQKNMYFLSACILAEDGETRRALSALNEAIMKGYRNYDQMMGDKHLKRLHGIREFTSISEKLRKQTDYLSVLRSSASYTQKPTTLPVLRYAPTYNHDLTKLQAAYQLDSIAGNGDETSRLINLMNWVHACVAHNGNIPIPDSRNALALLQERELDCRGLATILNEVYLALGYPSRITLCMPKDSADHENHTVVSVFSTTYSKWVMMDPTSDAYICDTSGHLLGLKEIRENIINGEPMKLNPEANWNGKVARTIDEYLYSYMTKNLFWFETPLFSTSGSETFAGGKRVDYLRLYPKAFKPSEATIIPYQHGTVFVTTNEHEFWQPPK